MCLDGYLSFKLDPAKKTHFGILGPTPLHQPVNTLSTRGHPMVFDKKLRLQFDRIVLC